MSDPELESRLARVDAAIELSSYIFGDDYAALVKRTRNAIASGGSPKIHQPQRRAGSAA